MFDFCKKTSRKVSTLTRFVPFMSFNKRKLLMNAFFTSHFSYCLLIWMCYSRTNNRKTKKHPYIITTIYNNKKSFFNKLLNKDSSVSIRIRNI